MRILVLGNGAREHAIAWRYASSRRLAGLFIAPGNAGTALLGTNLPELHITNPDQVLRACREHNINLVFVGGEEPLSAGVVDHLEEAGIAAIGPPQASARLESSKAFSKQFMLRHGIPTARAESFSDSETFQSYIRQAGGTKVIKKSGLAAGKGVLESDDKEQLIAFGSDILRSDSVIVEEFLSGKEVSVFALTDGTDYTLLPSAADFKKSGEGDTGSNTGGMGAISPVPWLDQAALTDIEDRVIRPTFRALSEEKLNYRGVLYFGLMLTEEGPKVLEYNVRLGDPEAQVVLPLIRTDFGSVSDALVSNSLKSFPIHVSGQTALAVVVASPGYPGAYPKGLEVTNLPDVNHQDSFLFHAATEERDGTVYTGGGRCFTAVSLGQDLLDARRRSYALAKEVQFDGAWYRSDIGGRMFD